MMRDYLSLHTTLNTIKNLIKSTLTSQHKRVFVSESLAKLDTQTTSPNISVRFLNSLLTNSLMCFQYFKFDTCFFINKLDLETQLTQLSRTLLQVTMDKYKVITTKDLRYRKIRVKYLTFRNSHSIIPAPLSAYKIYTT